VRAFLDHSQALAQLFTDIRVAGVLLLSHLFVNPDVIAFGGGRMKIPGSKSVCGIAGLVLMVAVGPALRSQAPSIAAEHPIGPAFDGGGRFGGFGAHAPVTGAPYSAVRVTTSVQTLANGSTITHVSQEKLARDSSGRTYMAELPSATNQGGSQRSFVRVFDPVNHTATSWSANSKQATVVHQPEEGQFRGARGPAAGETAGAGRFRGDGQAPTVESLGSKTINGIVVQGTRTTRVIPAGARGNSEPLTITHETWYSSELKIEVQRTETDPRFGTTTMELTNLDRSEPSAALFQAPEGFTVKEMTPGQRRGGFAAAQ
jgi:hypothetical protein